MGQWRAASLLFMPPLIKFAVCLRRFAEAVLARQFGCSRYTMIGRNQTIHLRKSACGRARESKGPSNSTLLRAFDTFLASKEVILGSLYSDR